MAGGRVCRLRCKVDAPEASSGPGWEIQEVSRVGAQSVTSKSKLLAREMPWLPRPYIRILVVLVPVLSRPKATQHVILFKSRPAAS